MGKHTPTPWPNKGTVIFNGQPSQLGSEIDRNGLQTENDFIRASACVNACETMEDPAAEIAALRVQRDELVRLLQDCRSIFLHENGKFDPTYNTICAALAKVAS